MASQAYGGAAHYAGGGAAYGATAYSGGGGGSYGCAAPGGNGISDVRLGDWNCPACFDLQFARNSQCRRCGTPRPGTATVAPTTQHGHHLEMRPGDWVCPRCNDHVFAKNDSCRRCSTPRPAGTQATSSVQSGHYAKPDWGSSSGMFSGHQSSLPPSAAASYGGGCSGHMTRAGDWFCPSCKDLQFARNVVCRRCGTPCPSPGGGCQPQMGLGAMAYGGGGGGYSAPAYGGGGAAYGGGGAAYGGSGAAYGGGGAAYGGGGGAAYGGGGGGGLEMRPGDWVCPHCHDHVFAKNDACRRCSTPRPVAEATYHSGSHGMKPGDWYCPQCQDLQFARNAVCRLCATPKPVEQSTPAHAGADGLRSRSRSPHRAA